MIAPHANVVNALRNPLAVIAVLSGRTARRSADASHAVCRHPDGRAPHGHEPTAHGHLSFRGRFSSGLAPKPKISMWARGVRGALAGAHVPWGGPADQGSEKRSCMIGTHQ